MKKKLSALLVAAMALSLAACGGSTASTASTAESAVSESAASESTAAESAASESSAAESVASESSAAESMTEEADGISFGDVMTYEEFAAAETDTLVTVETYVQAKQSWWEDKATIYTQAEDGAYFLYNMPCSEEEYDALVTGTKIKVAGYKAEWSGEIEIIDAIFEIEEGEFIAKATDVTGYLGTDDLANYMNQYVSFTGMTVEAAGKDEAGNDVAFLYNWDGSGQDGDDLYFNVSRDGQTYSFTVESYLTGAGTDVYEAVKALEVGQTVDLNGFLYWYEGANPHITSVSAA
ncbi:MAG: hypothetical protein K6E30_02865 [Lachnospiraceae bacterium]|nr:hypothetical protein [Lachnospiraceae bacterium]